MKITTRDNIIFVLAGVTGLISAIVEYTHKYPMLAVGFPAALVYATFVRFTFWRRRRPVELDWANTEHHKLTPEQCEMWCQKGRLNPEEFRRLYLNEPVVRRWEPMPEANAFERDPLNRA